MGTYIQPYRAPHDVNGNPRVMAVVIMDHPGEPYKEVAGVYVGYRTPGQAIREDYPTQREWARLYVESEEIVTVKRYRELRKRWED